MISDPIEGIAINHEGNFDLTKHTTMKKSIVVIALLMLGNFVLSSCSLKMFEGRTYVNGQHGTKQGAKAQARTDKQSKHFWF
jgi:hypothetical protein